MSGASFTPQATSALIEHAEYIAKQGAPEAGARMFKRVRDFAENVLVLAPRTGRQLDGNRYESTVPRTPLVLWYLIKVDGVIVTDVWHGSQNREA